MKNQKRPLKNKELTTEDKGPFFGRPKSGEPDSKPSRFFKQSGLQTKLRFGKSGDPSEKQADAVADKVVNTADNTPTVSKKDQDEGLQAKQEIRRQEEEEAQAKMEVQRNEEEESASAKFEINRQEEEDTGAAKYEVQRQEEEDMQAKAEVPSRKEEEPQLKMVQKKDSPYTSESFDKRLKDAKNRRGMPLPEKIREELESKMKADFNKVRIHTDDEAILLCTEIKAQAFTNGYHIYFNKGKFQPDTANGKHLLAHELTHVIQQKAPKRQ